MFDPGDRVLAMVSGGPDSVCLLYTLHMLRRLLKIELEVFHFDHRLRPDSAKDAQYVRRLSAKLDLPFHLREAVSKPAKGESVEDWARSARLKGLVSLRKERRLRRVAFGHTMDDQAETVLLALLRGGGLESVSGISPHLPDFARPLIDVRRSDVHAFVRALRLRPRTDPTNRNTRLMRNALRLEGIPALERAVGRDIVEPIARTAALLDLDRRFIGEEVRKAWPAVLSSREAMRVDLLAALDPSIRGRIVRILLQAAMHTLPEQPHVDAVLGLADGRPGRRVDLPGGFTAVREREYIRVSRPSPETSANSEWGSADAHPGNGPAD